MDVKQLKYFRAIAAEGTISGAAKQIFMTQPSLSQQLRLLEEELGVKLVHRGSRRIRLTDAGRLLYDRAGQVLEILNTTAIEVKELHEGFTGTLSIGTIASAGATLLPELIQAFHQQYFKVKFQLFEGDSTRILELLNNGLIEIGIIRSVFNSELYHWMDLPPEPFVIAESRDLGCNLQIEHMSVHALADKALLVHRSNERTIVEACRKAGFEPNIFCKGDDVRSLLGLANEGIGAAIVPKSALGLVRSDRISYNEIEDRSLVIEKAVIWMRNKYLSTAAKHFLDLISSHIPYK